MWRVSRHHDCAIARRDDAALLQGCATKKLDGKPLVLHFKSLCAAWADGDRIATARDKIQELALIVRERDFLCGKQLAYEVFAEALRFFDILKGYPALTGAGARRIEHGDLPFPLRAKKIFPRPDLAGRHKIAIVDKRYLQSIAEDQIVFCRVIGKIEFASLPF